MLLDSKIQKKNSLLNETPSLYYYYYYYANAVCSDVDIFGPKTLSLKHILHRIN
jgi:hypothetical protein